MTLDALIDAAAARGCKAFTLWPSPEGWQANVRNKDDGWSCASAATPADALRLALRAEPAVAAPTPAETEDGVFG